MFKFLSFFVVVFVDYLNMLQFMICVFVCRNICTLIMFIYFKMNLGKGHNQKLRDIIGLFLRDKKIVYTHTHTNVV